jgi:hypothetical protein
MLEATGVVTDTGDSEELGGLSLAEKTSGVNQARKGPKGPIAILLVF